MDKITDIVVVRKQGARPQFHIAGSGGALIADEAGHVTWSIGFDFGQDHVDIVDVNGDGVEEYLNRGNWSYPAALIGRDGAGIWTYGGMPGVDDAASGDINGDGALEFVVGFNGDGGVRLIDKNGKMIWRQPDGNVWHVEMVDANGDGRPEIVHSNAGGEMTIRDKHGSVLGRSRPGPYFSHFSLCAWPTRGARRYALLAEDDVIWLFDFKGNVRARFRAPACGTLGMAWGTTVKLRRNEPGYLAVIVEYDTYNKSILYLYEPGGKLVYQEALPEACGSIAAAPLAKSSSEALLVGGTGRVWRYDAAKP